MPADKPKPETPFVSLGIIPNDEGMKTFDAIEATSKVIPPEFSVHPNSDAFGKFVLVGFRGKIKPETDYEDFAAARPVFEVWERFFDAMFKLYGTLQLELKERPNGSHPHVLKYLQEAYKHCVKAQVKSRLTTRSDPKQIP